MVFIPCMNHWPQQELFQQAGETLSKDATFLQKQSHCMCRFLCGAQLLIWMDKKRLHSFFSFKVNSSTSCSRLSYCAGVSPQKLSMSVTWQWIWEDSPTHLKAKDTTLRGFHTNMCVHTPYTICGFFQYTCNLVLCPLIWEVFWMPFKPHQTYRQCSINRSHWNTITGKKLSSSCPSPCLPSVGSTSVSPRPRIVQ